MCYEHRSLTPILSDMIGSAEWVWLHISPVVVVVIGMLLVITLFNLVTAAFSDPGIIPRSHRPLPPIDDPTQDHHHQQQTTSHGGSSGTTPRIGSFNNDADSNPTTSISTSNNNNISNTQKHSVVPLSPDVDGEMASATVLFPTDECTTTKPLEPDELPLLKGMPVSYVSF
jgi:cytoskeletal protein RodZ